MEHSITPTMAKNNNYEFKKSNSKLQPLNDGAYYFVDGGYMYRCSYPGAWFSSNGLSYKPTKMKLP
jgi:hypothetical protein